MNAPVQIMASMLFATALSAGCDPAPAGAPVGAETSVGAVTSSDETIAGYGQRLHARLVDNAGRRIGTVQAWQAQRGLLLEISASDLAPGAHGLHLHSVGVCSDVGRFERSGGHISGARAHGFLHPDGPHPGDLPNLYVGDDGTARLDIFTTLLSLETLTDRDGAALVIHGGRDDYQTPPTGGSGARVACAEFASRSGAQTADGGNAS